MHDIIDFQCVQDLVFLQIINYVVTLTSPHRILLSRKNMSYPGSFLYLAIITIT